MHLLKKNDLSLGIEIHSDPFSIIPAAISRKRAFKVNKAQPKDMEDNDGGAEKCLLCNPELLDQKPELDKHHNGRVVSFPNAAPFLPGDQRVVCLWHDDKDKRHRFGHRFRLDTFNKLDMYYLLITAVELAKNFPKTRDGQTFQRGIKPYRCIAGFNLGQRAGQSIPHFHLQYGWDFVLSEQDVSPELFALYYKELFERRLIIHGYEEKDEEFMVVVPWTPKGQHHLEIHFKEVYELSQLTAEHVKTVAHLGHKILERYLELKIRDVNILFTGSPFGKVREPLVVQFIPRVNVPALYEMIGVNVVDKLPETTAGIFASEIRWSDQVREARAINFEGLYDERFAQKTESEERIVALRQNPTGA